MRFTHGDPIPQAAVVKFKYDDTYRSGTVTGTGPGVPLDLTTYTQRWQMGDLDAPRSFPASVRQPYAHDYYMNIFRQYTVIGVRYKIKVTMFAGNEPVRACVRAGINVAAAATHISDVSMEPGTSKVKTVCSVGSNSNVMIFTGTVSPRRLWGVNKETYYGNLGFTGVFQNLPSTIQPANPTFLDIFMTSVGDYDVLVECTLHYFAKLVAPNLLPPS